MNLKPLSRCFEIAYLEFLIPLGVITLHNLTHRLVVCNANNFKFIVHIIHKGVELGEFFCQFYD
jgi:hypothetical protein